MSEELKYCPKCKLEVVVSGFSRNKSKKDGLNSHCNDCRKRYREENKDRIAKSNKKYRSKNFEKISNAKKNYYRKNKEDIASTMKSYYEANRDEILKYAANYRANNKEKLNEYSRKRRANDPLFAIVVDLRNRTLRAFNRAGYSKGSKTADMLGADWSVVKDHIESRFNRGMSWENKGKWHIDHIIPLASANTEDELIQLCHYTNLQPLWAEDNLAKADKIIACRINI